MKPPFFEIPRELRIRNKKWLIIRDHELGDGKHDARSRLELRSINDGICYPEGYPHIKREIHLSSDLRGERESEILIHELLHACSSQKIDLNSEEKFVQDVSLPLLRVIKQLRKL